MVCTLLHPTAVVLVQNCFSFFFFLAFAVYTIKAAQEMNDAKAAFLLLLHSPATSLGSIILFLLLHSLATSLRFTILLPLHLLHSPAISLGFFFFFCIPQLYLWGSSSAFPTYTSGVHLSSSSAFPSYISGVHHSSSAFPSYISGVHHSSSSAFPGYISGVHHFG